MSQFFTFIQQHGVWVGECTIGVVVSMFNSFFFFFLFIAIMIYNIVYTITMEKKLICTY